MRGLRNILMPKPHPDQLNQNFCGWNWVTGKFKETFQAILRCSQGWDMQLKSRVRKNTTQNVTEAGIQGGAGGGDRVWRWYKCTAVSSWLVFSAASSRSINTVSPAAPLPPASSFPSTPESPPLHILFPGVKLRSHSQHCCAHSPGQTTLCCHPSSL